MRIFEIITIIAVLALVIGGYFIIDNINKKIISVQDDVSSKFTTLNSKTDKINSFLAAPDSSCTVENLPVGTAGKDFCKNEGNYSISEIHLFSTGWTESKDGSCSSPITKDTQWETRLYGCDAYSTQQEEASFGTCSSSQYGDFRTNRFMSVICCKNNI